MTRYQRIEIPGDVFDQGPDQNGRARASFNVVAVCEPTETFEEELLRILEDAGVGTIGTTMLASTAAQVPVLASGDPAPFLTVRAQAGLAGRRQNTGRGGKASPGYSWRRPGAQVVCRAESYADAREMALAAFVALSEVQNRDVVP